ncbi:MAG: hypothetical protein ABIG66_01480 [Candidatus Kerfeldbacteria bacterium]
MTTSCSSGGFCATKSKPFRIALFTMAVLLVSSVVLASALPDPASSQTTEASKEFRVFSAVELEAFDGKDGRLAYTAYEQVIYDVSNSPLFEEGNHFSHAAGKDLTPLMTGAPHGGEVFAEFAIVGRLGETAGVQLETTEDEGRVTRAGAGGRILLLGISVLGWTGFLMAIVFILAFATCYAMPWSKRFVAWTGILPGKDRFDGAATLRWNFYHSIFAWATIIVGCLHGVIGIFQSFGFYI